jgi:hypothetical protein
MNLLSLPVSAHARDDQFVSDLASLLRRYRVRTGTPDCLNAFAPQLQANDSLRSDLFALCNAISRMCEADLTPEELLNLVARAVGGPLVLSDNGTLPSEVVEVFTSGLREWQARIDNQPEFSFEAPEEDEAWRKANKFAAAASMNARQASGGADVTSIRGEIPPQTPIGDLTLSELRSYLDEIEQRVGRLQPFLESLRGTAVTEVLNVAPGELEPSITVLPSEEQTLENQELESPGGQGKELGAQNAIAVDETTSSSSEPETEAGGAPEAGNAPPANARSEVRPVDAEIAGRLLLRGRPNADSPQPYLFRSLEEQEPSRSGGLLWVAAVLALLAPLGYFGRRYVETQPPVQQIAPPRAPTAPIEAQPAATAEHSRIGASPEASPTPTRPARRATSTTHLDSRAVRMAAEAARAEEQSNRPTR